MTKFDQTLKDEELIALQIADFDQEVVEDGLVGLAFSGGGIRSATFGLGVLEALKDTGLLRRIHYLSTVSGGGYIGAWLSANCRRTADDPVKPVEDFRSPASRWATSVSHLRRYSNYLSPDVGFFSADTWSMFTVWMRNALLVQWTVVMAIACVLLVPRLLAVLFARWYDFEHLRWLGVICFVLGVVGIAGNQQWMSRGRATGLMRAGRWRAGLGLCGLCVLVIVAYSWVFGFRPFAHGPSVGTWESLFIAALVVIAGYSLLPGVVTFYGWWRKRLPRPRGVNYSQGQVQRYIVVPMLATGFFVGAVLWGEINRSDGKLVGLHTYGEFFLGAWRHWPFPLAVVFCSLWVLSLCSVQRIWSWKALGYALQSCLSMLLSLNWKGLLVAFQGVQTVGNWRGVLAAVLSPFACVTVLHALLCAIMLLLQDWQPRNVAQAFVVAPPLVLFAFSITVVVLIGMMGRQSTEGVREWWSRLGAWLLIYGFAWMLVAVAAVYAPGWVYAAFDIHPWKSWSTALGWLGTVATGLFAGHSDQTGQPDAPKARNPILGLVAQVAPFVFIGGLLVAVATALDRIIGINTNEVNWADLWASTAGWPFLKVSGTVLIVSSVILGLLGLRININEFSLNAFYRSRLVRCFLGATRPPARRRPQAFTAFDDDDDLALSSLAPCGDSLAGPLHIVNCALNLGGAGDLSLHTRHSASFTLTPFQIGSDYCYTDDSGVSDTVGHAGTPAYGTATGRTTLGQAIAVSGAAASPNMGYHTSPVVAFLLTVFNLRLGWWFPHPSRIGTGRTAPHFNLPYMFMELFGGATYQSDFLMVSDGGHFENLAVYELIKRRCRVIICSDAECDPKLTFEGLGTLIRMCEVDLDATIKIDVGEAHSPRRCRWSEQRCAVGTITYRNPDATGIFIYLKAAMTGHEPAAVLQYKASHPAFPHETTGDQFYAEDQFESYRRLGKEVTCRAFDTALAAERARTLPNGTPRPLDMLDLAETVRATNAPSLEATSRFTTHSQSLIELWNRISDHDELVTLDGALAPAATKTARLEAYTSLEMIQLMENVFLDLQLEETWEHADNQGWRALFVTWAQTPQVKETWAKSSSLFGVRFQHFCRIRLKL